MLGHCGNGHQFLDLLSEKKDLVHVLSLHYIYFCFIGYVKAFDCVDHNKLENRLSSDNYYDKNVRRDKWLAKDDACPLGRVGQESLFDEIIFEWTLEN